MRTYVVSGAASGIGAATAALLREQGGRVITVDLHDADVTADNVIGILLATFTGRSRVRSAIRQMFAALAPACITFGIGSLIGVDSV